MDQIKRVGILGAGAMGAFFAERFSSVPEIESGLIADAAHADRLKNDGLVINSKPCHFTVFDTRAAVEPLDLIIVALKHPQLANALTDIRPLVKPDTLFLSVMNGLDSEEIISAVYGKEKVLYAISVGIDAVREGNRVTYTKPGRHIFGEAENSHPSQKVLRVKNAFEKAGIQYEIPIDMLRTLWWKFMVNVGVNQASAVLRAPYGVFHTNPHAQALMEALMQEVVTLAQAKHIQLNQQDVEDWYPVLNTLSPAGKTSMLQDIEAGRPTEVEVFGEKVIDLGKELGIPTPANQTIVQIIRVMEAHSTINP